MIFLTFSVIPPEWKGYPMTCPDGTGFDASIEACNYVAHVKACAKGKTEVKQFKREGHKIVYICYS